MSAVERASGARRWLPRRHTDTAAAPAAVAAGAGAAALHEVGAHFVIAPGNGNGTGAAALPATLTDALTALEAVPGTVTVLAAAPDAQPVLLGRLADLARTAADRNAATLVLAASALAAAPASGPRPAQRIAEIAATSIVAPDGLVTLRPDGTLLTTGATDTEPSSWWLFTPDGRTRRLGPVWPLPRPDAGAARGRAGTTATAAAAPAAAGPAPSPAAPAGPVAAAAAQPAAEPVAEPASEGAADPLMTVLPHGFWFHGGPGPAAVPSPLLRAAAAPGTAVLVVGRPDAPLPPAADIAAITTAAASATASARPVLPGADPAELLVSAPWADTAQLVALAGALAVALGHDVRAAVGLPTHTASGWSSRVLGADGAPAWEPWLTELTASIELGRVIASAWRPLPAAFAVSGPALHQAPVAGWRLEAVPAGLWLRPDRTPDDRGPRLLDPDPARPTLIAGSADRPAPAEVLAVLEDLASALTEPGAPAPHLLLPGTPSIHRAPTAAPAAPEPLTPEAPTTPAPAESHTEPPEPLTPATAATVTTESTDTPDHGDEQLTPPEPTTPQDPLLAQAPAEGDSEPIAPATATTTESTTASGSPDSAAAPRLLVPPTGAGAAGRVSTAAERAAFRALLGADFHRYASRAEQAALRMPALRAQSRDDLRDDLAAVYLHHTDTGIPVHRAELVEAARRTAGGEGPLAGYLACLGSGLRRLPNHRGAVLLGADVSASVLAQYTRGALLVEPAPVVGTAQAEVVPGTDVEFLLWSATGRRTSVIAEDGDPEVVFPPGTHFLVLDVLPADEDRPARVLLRESVPGGAGDEAADEQDRARLLAWQERRDRIPAERLRASARPERLHLALGVTPR
ncbi:hypothetical protein ACGF0D_17825 [Kitasatospora sp. NPDC048298]|uniref:hypothetical protein n=1 Tax=Kitasatospora sp. NPDC048298 TaxID=3364049 RepID=UPI0037116F2E